MRPAHHPIPATRPVLRRWLGRSSVAGVLIVASLGLVACGSSGSPETGSSRSPKLLNATKIERAIERSSLAQRGKHVRVTCPSGVPQEKGLVFECTAVYSGGSTQFTVTELDSRGHVHYVAR